MIINFLMAFALALIFMIVVKFFLHLIEWIGNTKVYSHRKGRKVMEEYNLNADFKEYVDKYCQRENITPEVAVTHAIVQGVEKEYKNNRINRKR